MKVKICGLRQQQNIQDILSLSPDYMGLIFYPGSKRFVDNREGLASWLRPRKNMGKTGVFVHEKEEVILQTADSYGLDYVQLHGDETPVSCAGINAVIPVIKAFRIGAAFDFDLLLAYTGACTYFLFDTAGAGYGGNGRSFDWGLLKDREIPLPFFLSGGIGPEAVTAIKALQHTNLMAVDVNSRFEAAPGIKNINALKKFIHEIRN